ncbi:acyl-CoA N-acyltransferase [Thozetella sp. PMI_491]|nr:acyl-CoA N-acyltransferase [Thozetella sp. PMI_491]
MDSRSSWKIEPVRLTDVPAMARNNFSAFWETYPWRINWGADITLDFLIEQLVKRGPNNLLKDREILRHIKAVDPQTGSFVGYLRFKLPPGHTRTAGGEPTLFDLQIPDVSPEERKHIKEVSDNAWWGPIANGSDDKNIEIRARLLGEGTYIELDYLAVHPENKGRGIATALVKKLIEMADELGLDIFVVAWAGGRPVYQKFNFQIVETNIEDLANWGFEGEYPSYFMVYDTKKTTSGQTKSAQEEGADATSMASV